MKKLLFTALFGLILAFSALADSNSPVDFVRDNAQQVLNLIKNEDGSNTQKIRDQLEVLVIPSFDFKRMTAYAVGKNWRLATPEQQIELATQFQALLTRVYASTMTRYKNAQIDVNPTPVLTGSNGQQALVRSIVTLPNNGDKKSIAVDYELYKTTQGWKVFNIKVEGASLVTVYRDQFDSIVNAHPDPHKGIESLIRSLQDKNAKLAQGS